MGLTRQAVQRLANEMERDGLVRLAPNPHRQRAKLMLLTPRGKSAYDSATKRREPWASSLANGLSIKQINAATARFGPSDGVSKTSPDERTAMHERIHSVARAIAIKAQDDNPCTR